MPARARPASCSIGRLTLEGTLKAGKGEHDAQGPFAYVYLELDRPVCVDAPPAAAGDEDAAESIGEAVTRVQIAGEASNQQLPIGKRVSVEGTLFPAHTMWHAEPVLIDAAAVALRCLGSCVRPRCTCRLGP